MNHFEIIRRLIIGFLVSFFLFIALFIGDLIYIYHHRATMLTYILWDIAGIMPRYHAIMDIPVEVDGKTVPCRLYQRSGSPFLLLGPYPFLEETPVHKAQSDFFFIGRDYMRGRCLDDKTDDWTSYGKWVWIGQDMDPAGFDSYAPHYPFEETRTYDSKTGDIVFTCSEQETDKVVHYRFAVPKRLVDALPELK